MAKRRADPTAVETRYVLVTPDGDVPIDFEATVAAYERTMRYAVSRRRPTVAPLLALLDEVEPALLEKFTRPQCVPAHDSAHRLRRMLSTPGLDDAAASSPQIRLGLLMVAEAFRMFSPFLDSQPFQQALDDVHAMPGIRTARTKGGQTRSEDAVTERREVRKWASEQNIPSSGSVRARATRLAARVPLKADGTYDEPFHNFGVRLARASRKEPHTEKTRQTALVRCIAGHLADTNRNKQA